LQAVELFTDDRELNHIVSTANEVMQLNGQLLAKTGQYLKHFSDATACGNGTDNTMFLIVENICI